MPYIGNITQDFNVSNAMLDTDSVTSIKIVDGTIEGADIAANLDLSDNQKIRFGAGNDLEIYHDGSNSRITNSTGSLVLNSRVLIKTADNSESIATFNENGAVELYYDNSKKFETTSAGATVTGSLTVTDDITLQDNLFMGDGDEIQIGDGSDLRIYHDGVNSKFVNTTGFFVINTDQFTVNDAGNNHGVIRSYENAQVELYHNGSKKFETTSTGATVTGTLIADGLTLYDNEKLLIGTNTDIEVFHDGTNSIFQSDTGDLQINSGNSAGNVEINLNNNVAGNTRETSAKFIKNGAVELYYDNNKKLETKSDGVLVTGELQATTLDINGSSHLDGTAVVTGNLDMPDNAKVLLGTGDDLQIYHDGSNSYIQDTDQGNLFIEASAVLIRKNGTTENIAKFIQDGAVELYHDNSKKLETTSTGSQTTGMHLIKGNSDIDNQFNPLLFLQDSTNTNIKAVFLLEDDYTTGRAALAINVGESGVTNDRDLMLQKAGGRVGIRCTPTTNFEVSGTSKFNGAIKLGDSNELRLGTGDDFKMYHDGVNSLTFFDTQVGGTRFRTNVGSSARSNIILGTGVDLYYDNSKKFETTSSGATVTGSLGIGTTSPDQTLHVHKGSAGSISSTANSVLTLENSNDSILQFLSPSSNVNQIRFGDPSDNGAGYIDYNHGNNALSFGTAGPERMRLDSSGNLGLGTNSPGGKLHVSSGNNGNCILILEADTDNNNEDDNPLIFFRQDGGLDLSAIGTGLTGTSSDNHLTLANSAANGGISFRTGTSNGYTNAVERMRILAGGGLTFNGDTSTNNALSDYEQGTWTATAEFNTGGFKSCSNNVCRYVKVGTLVHISGRFSLNNHTGASSGELRIEGLPFSKGNPSGDGNSDGISIYVEGAATNITNGISGLVLDNTTRFLIRRSGTTASGNDMAGKTDSGTTLLVGGTYSTFG